MVLVVAVISLVVILVVIATVPMDSLVCCDLTILLIPVSALEGIILRISLFATALTVAILRGLWMLLSVTAFDVSIFRFLPDIRLWLAVNLALEVVGELEDWWRDGAGAVCLVEDREAVTRDVAACIVLLGAASDLVAFREFVVDILGDVLFVNGSFDVAFDAVLVGTLDVDVELELLELAMSAALAYRQ